MNDRNTVFHIHFYQDDRKLTLVARQIVINDALPSFVGIEEIVFEGNKGGVINPTHDSLKKEFGDVKSLYLSYQQIIRIDEVKQAAKVKVVEKKQESQIFCPPGAGRIIAPNFLSDDE